MVATGVDKLAVDVADMEAVIEGDVVADMVTDMEDMIWTETKLFWAETYPGLRIF